MNSNPHQQQQQQSQFTFEQQQQDQSQSHSGDIRNRDRNDNIIINNQLPYITTTSNQIEQIKLQLSLMNQQLLESILSDNDNDKPHESIKPIQIIKMISKLEQSCDEITKAEVQLQRRQIAIEMKEKSFEIERCELELSKREFELSKRDAIYQNQQHLQSLILSSSPPTSISSLVELPSTESSINNVQQHHQPSSSSLSAPIDEQTTTSTIQSMMGLLQHVMEDYQAMKYLVDQSTTTQQSLQQQYFTFNQSMNNFNHVKNMNDKLELSLSKVNEFELQLQQFQQSLTEQSTLIEGINNNSQKQIQQQIETTNRIEQQRVSLPAVLQQNNQLFTSRSNRYLPSIAFTFENLPGVNMSCGECSDCNFHSLLHTYLIDNILKTDLQQHKSTIEKSKVFISSKSVLNGEWIQIQGDDKVIDIKNIKLHSLLKPGDDIYDYNDYPCSKSCGHCRMGSKAKTTKCFLIKFKWQ